MLTSASFENITWMMLCIFHTFKDLNISMNYKWCKYLNGDTDNPHNIR